MPMGLMSWEVLELRVRPGALSFSSPHQPALAVICCIPVSESPTISEPPSFSRPLGFSRLCLSACVSASPPVSPCLLSSLTLSRWPLSPVGAPAALAPSQPGCFYACPLQMSAHEGSFCLSGSQRHPNPSNSAWQTGGAQ